MVQNRKQSPTHIQHTILNETNKNQTIDTQQKQVVQVHWRVCG